MDILCLHIFLLILLNCHIDLMIFGWNWLLDLPQLVFPKYFLSDFEPSSGRMYYKSDVTFVCTLLLFEKKSVCSVVLCSVYFSNLFYK